MSNVVRRTVLLGALLLVAVGLAVLVGDLVDGLIGLGTPVGFALMMVGGIALCAGLTYSRAERADAIFRLGYLAGQRDAESDEPERRRLHSV